MLPPLAVLVGCEKAAINTMVLSYSNRRKLQETCPAGFTYSPMMELSTTLLMHIPKIRREPLILTVK
jgi:hypothetical protein